MDLTIWKFPLTKRGNVDRHELDEEIEIPCAHRILCVGPDPASAERPHHWAIWAIVNPEAPKNRYKVSVRGTGRDISDVADHRYIGTVFEGPWVWHVFIDGRDMLSLESLQAEIDNLDIPEDEGWKDDVSEVQGEVDDLKMKAEELENRIDDLEERRNS